MPKTWAKVGTFDNRPDAERARQRVLMSSMRAGKPVRTSIQRDGSLHHLYSFPTTPKDPK